MTYTRVRYHEAVRSLREPELDNKQLLNTFLKSYALARKVRRLSGSAD